MWDFGIGIRNAGIWDWECGVGIWEQRIGILNLGLGVGIWECGNEGLGVGNAGLGMRYLWECGNGTWDFWD